MALKNAAAYKTEYNSLIVGATAMLQRAVQVRKNLAQVTGGNHVNSANGKAVTAVSNSIGALKTYKGTFERNAR